MWRGLGRPGPVPEGQRIVAPLQLRPVTGFRDPGTYDYAAHHAREVIYVVATSRAESVTPLDDPAPPWSVRVKRESVVAIARALPPASAALLAELLLDGCHEPLVLRRLSDGSSDIGLNAPEPLVWFVAPAG
jgi:hypothetical protein